MFAIDKVDILMAYLITDVAKEIFNDNRREYGDGLEKFEPNDLNHSKVVNLQAIPSGKAQEITDLFSKYRVGVARNRPDITLLEVLNRIFSKLLTR
jgi:adenine-specific DNA-methyltransferase